MARSPKPKWIGGFCALSTLAVIVMPASGDERTGTHLESETARPAVVYLSKPNAIDEILRLIQSERNEEAVALARKHVATIRSVKVMKETPEPAALYSALNALCVALTTTGQTDEALATCSEAIDRAPRQWIAWNSRGTTHFADLNFDAALTDFHRAFALAPHDKNIVETIQSNIRLTNERLIGN